MYLCMYVCVYIYIYIYIYVRIYISHVGVNMVLAEFIQF